MNANQAKIRPDEKKSTYQQRFNCNSLFTLYVFYYIFFLQSKTAQLFRFFCFLVNVQVFPFHEHTIKWHSTKKKYSVLCIGTIVSCLHCIFSVNLTALCYASYIASDLIPVQHLILFISERLLLFQNKSHDKLSEKKLFIWFYHFDGNSFAIVILYILVNTFWCPIEMWKCFKWNKLNNSKINVNTNHVRTFYGMIYFVFFFWMPENSIWNLRHYLWICSVNWK